MSLHCWNCGASLDGVPLPISRHANCEQCFEVLHCCRMCRHYREDGHTSCDHDRADPPVIKESANFCDYFKPANRFDKAGAARATSAKSDFAALFDDENDESGDETGTGVSDPGSDNLPAGEDDALKNKFDDLFDD